MWHTLIGICGLQKKNIYMNLSVCANIVIDIDNTNANKADIL